MENRDPNFPPDGDEDWLGFIVPQDLNESNESNVNQTFNNFADFISDPANRPRVTRREGISTWQIQLGDLYTTPFQHVVEEGHEPVWVSFACLNIYATLTMHDNNRNNDRISISIPDDPPSRLTSSMEITLSETIDGEEGQSETIKLIKISFFYNLNEIWVKKTGSRGAETALILIPDGFTFTLKYGLPV